MEIGLIQFLKSHDMGLTLLNLWVLKKIRENAIELPPMTLTNLYFWNIEEQRILSRVWFTEVALSYTE